MSNRQDFEPAPSPLTAANPVTADDPDDLRRAATRHVQRLAEAIAEFGPDLTAGGPVVIPAACGFVTLRVQISPVRPPRRRRCDGDILAVLALAGGRVRGRDVRRLLAAHCAATRADDHGETTITHALARLVRAGLVLSDPRRDGGYKLTEAGRAASATPPRTPTLFDGID